MSSMLEQAVIDAAALKEVALKNAEATVVEKYSTEVVLQGFNSAFKILSSKNSQGENLQTGNDDSSSLPNEQSSPSNEQISPSNDLDDEIPF